MATNVDTDNIASVLLEKLNEGSMLSFVTSVADTLNTQSGSDLTGVQDQINLIKTKMTEVETEAKVLSADELAQVEQALKDVLTNLKSNGFLGLLCVELGGQKYSMTDLVSRMATADRVQSVEHLWDAGYNNITSTKMTLEDGSIISFVPTVDETDVAKNYTFNADWKGLPASFAINLAKVPRNVNINGAQVTNTEYVLTKKTNILFSLTTGLSNCVETSIDATVPDLNGDTKIGTQPVVAPVFAIASTSGSVDVGSSVAVAFTNAQGAVTAISSDNAVASVIVGANSVSITGVSAGDATVSISDGATTQSYAVSVNAVAVVTPMTADKSALSIDVGSSDTITMSNADGAISAISSNPALISVSVAGNVVTVNALGATDPDTVNVSISDGDETVVVTAYSAVSGGGGL